MGLRPVIAGAGFYEKSAGGGGASLPSQTGHAGDFLSTDGTNPEWIPVSSAIRNKTASHTLELADAGGMVEMEVAGANNVTVPPNADVAFAIGVEIELFQYGAGQTTVVPGAGVTIRSAGGALKLAAQYSSAALKKRAINEWILVGDISA